MDRGKIGFYIDILSFTSVIAYLVEAIFQFKFFEISIFQWFCSVVFFLEWIFFFSKAENRWRYFKFRFFDLLSAFPWSGFFVGFRLFRVIKVLRDSMIFKNFIRTIKFQLGEGDGVFFEYFFYSFIIYFFCSASIYEAEIHNNKNINNFFDALWLGFTTVTTVGYGDIAPVTLNGKFLCAILNVFGMGVFGLFVMEIAKRLSTGRQDE